MSINTDDTECVNSIQDSTSGFWDEAARARIRALIQGRGSQAEIAKTAGMSASNLSHLLSAKGGEPGVSKLAALCKVLGVSMDYVLTGVGSSGAIDPIDRTAVPWETFSVPALHDVEASAGDGSLVPVAQMDHASIRFPEAWLRENFGQVAGLRLLKVKGDSQEPDLRDGDWIMIDIQRATLENGLFVLTLDEMLMVKRVQLEGAAIALTSRNEVYQPVRIDKREYDERVRLIGRVVWTGKML